MFLFVLSINKSLCVNQDGSTVWHLSCVVVWVSKSHFLLSTWMPCATYPFYSCIWKSNFETDLLKDEKENKACLDYNNGTIQEPILFLLLTHVSSSHDFFPSNIVQTKKNVQVVKNFSDPTTS